MVGERLTNPLSPEHLVRIRAIYRSLLEERTWFTDFPRTPAWIRWRYLNDTNTTSLASCTFDDSPTISIHPEAFEYPNPVLLIGLVHHEMLHIYHGAEVAHGPMFRESERSWVEYHRYRMEKKRFFRLISELAVGTRNYSYRCPKCQSVLHRNEPLSSDSACLACCKAFNNGKWCEAYTLIRVGVSR